MPGFEPDASNPIDPDPGDGATMQFNRSWDIRSDTPEAGVMSITVRVSWTDNLGTVRNATIQTLKLDP